MICGGPRTGKTHRLVEHAAKLVSDGASPRDIIVFAATPDAVDAMRRRLARANEALTDVDVMTVRKFVMGVLSSPEARELTGREPRVLDGYEVSFLLEDMKRTGIRPKRIKGMLGFFYRCYTELENIIDPEWLELKEEVEAHTRLTMLLDSQKAYLEAELSNAAYRTLSSDESVLARFKKAHVIVDDYQTLSKASQVVANLIASESICIAGDPGSCVQAFESYPYVAGMGEFANALPHASHEDLDEAHMGADRLSAIQTLYGHAELALEKDGAKACAPTTAQGNDAFEIRECLNPDDELTQVRDWICAQIDEGTDAQDIAVIVPGTIWERRVAKALREANIATRPQSAAFATGGDIRYEDACRPARVLCLLSLAANPDDEASLRAWCGFGEYTVNAQVFDEIREICGREGSTLRETLTAMAHGMVGADSFQFASEAETVVHAYEELGHHLKALAGLKGKALVTRVLGLIYQEERPSLPLSLAHALSLANEDDDAASLYAKIARMRLFPRLPEGDGVRIMRVDACCGVEAKAVAVMGIVNGFTPPHKAFDTVAVAPDRAEAMRSRAARELIVSMGLASDATLVTYFTEVPYREAEKLDLKVERIFIKDGLRRARVAKSILLD